MIYQYRITYLVAHFNISRVDLSRLVDSSLQQSGWHTWIIEVRWTHCQTRNIINTQCINIVWPPHRSSGWITSGYIGQITWLTLVERLVSWLHQVSRSPWIGCHLAMGRASFIAQMNSFITLQRVLTLPRHHSYTRCPSNGQRYSGENLPYRLSTTLP